MAILTFQGFGLGSMPDSRTVTNCFTAPAGFRRTAGIARSASHVSHVSGPVSGVLAIKVARARLMNLIPLIWPAVLALLLVILLQAASQSRLFVIGLCVALVIWLAALVAWFW